MKLLRVIERYRQTISLFRAYTYRDLMWQALEVPFDYWLRGGQSRLPININLFVTLRCNARCSFCNLKGILNTNVREMSLEEIDGFIETVRRRKPGFILFGGEPFVRKDILDIVQAVKKRNLTCGIFTNGLALDKDRIRALVKLKLDYIVFSLQGPEQIHDSLTGVPGAYGRLIESLETFISQRVDTKVIIHTTLSPDNITHLDEIIKTGDKTGADAVRLGHPTYFTQTEVDMNRRFFDANFSGEAVSLLGDVCDGREDGDAIAKASERLTGRFARFTPELDHDEIIDWYSDEFKSKRKCLFVYRGVFIYPNGDVYPCESFKYRMGNILDQPFQDIWNSERYVKFRRMMKQGLYPGCARCCKL